MNLGITGHQKLSAETSAWTYKVLYDRISTYPTPITGISSLAVGADQIFARAVLAAGGKLHAVLPYKGIERSFSKEDLPTFKKLLARASREVLQITGTDEDAYLAAGQRVVDLSDLLFTVWNGLPAKGKGGTADVVAYAEERGVAVIHLNSETHQVAFR